MSDASPFVCSPKSRPIYLDHHATTPVDPRVYEEMRPYLESHFGNPASKTHEYGWQAEAAVTIARERVAGLIHAARQDIIWTSGTTESIHVALLGAAREKKRGHIISCVTEHRSVLGALSLLREEGFEVTLLPVDGDGRLDPEDVRRALRPETILISMTAANHEIGTLPPLADIGKIAKESGAIFHVDAAQACGKIPLNVAALGIDLMSLSSHKIYGPKGAGALYVRSRGPHVRLKPLFRGGGQEKDLRPGTLPVADIVGMGKAYEIAANEMNADTVRIRSLRDRLKNGLEQRLPDLQWNGTFDARLPGNLNVSFRGVRADALMGALKSIAVSSGSACASGEGGGVEPSSVILALGGGEDRALSSIRFGLGRFTTEEEITTAIDEISKAVETLRRR